MWNYKIIVIGGGPVGIYAATKLHAKGVSYHVFEADTALGGQPIALYPEKSVDDVPSLGVHSGQGIIQSLLKLTSINDFTTTAVVTDLVEKEDHVEIRVNGETITAEYVFVATGLGFHTPRHMEIPDEEKCSNILYSVKDFSIMENKHVVIFGGGDSALDWAKAISAISPYVSLVHRRTEFRGDPATIKDCKVDLYLALRPRSSCLREWIGSEHQHQERERWVDEDSRLRLRLGQLWPDSNPFDLWLTIDPDGLWRCDRSDEQSQLTHLRGRRLRLSPGRQKENSAGDGRSRRGPYGFGDITIGSRCSNGLLSSKNF
jgi:hypothetical protein